MREASSAWLKPRRNRPEAAANTPLYRHNAGAYQFKRDLYIGLSGNDVIELQKRFAREGLANYAPIGHLGDKAKASAIAYQTKHNVSPEAGYVGPNTRAVLNSGTAVVQPTANVIADPDAVLLSELAMWDSSS
jgi:peptidoglycan hydrolase-like protein with peptidoglycan-binding domain